MLVDAPARRELRGKDFRRLGGRHPGVEAFPITCFGRPLEWYLLVDKSFHTNP
jgi:hypothetical protein